MFSFIFNTLLLSGILLVLVIPQEGSALTQKFIQDFPQSCIARGGEIVKFPAAEKSSFIIQCQGKLIASILTGEVAENIEAGGTGSICCTKESFSRPMQWTVEQRVHIDKYTQECSSKGGAIEESVYNKTSSTCAEGVVPLWDPANKVTAALSVNVGIVEAGEPNKWISCCATASSRSTGSTVGSPRVSGSSGVIPEFFFQIPIGELRSIGLCETGSDGKLSCSGIATYIQAIYRFLVGFAAVLAVLALVFGGVRWLTSGGESGKIQEARKIIGNSLIGLLIALGSYALLSTLGKQFVEYKPISIRVIKQIPLNITPTTISAGGISATYDVNRFAAYGFPPPNIEPDPGGKKMEGETLQRWNQYKDLAMKAAQETGTDIGFIGMWSFLENNFDTFMDNCADTDSNPNTPCTSWGSNWQVGLGIHPGNMLWAYEDGVRAMYGNTNNVTVQGIGQSVLNAAKTAGKPLTLVSDPFPIISLNTTINAAKNGDQNARLLIATLSKDPALGLYLVGAHFGSKDVGGEPKNEMAQRMNGWPPAGAYTPQRISNLIKAIYDAK